MKDTRTASSIRNSTIDLYHTRLVEALDSSYLPSPFVLLLQLAAPPCRHRTGAETTTCCVLHALLPANSLRCLLVSRLVEVVTQHTLSRHRRFLGTSV